MIEILLAPQLQPVWILLIAILVERLWAWPDRYHPLGFARLLAHRMAAKVNDSGSNPTQQKISGVLAPATLLLPLLAILAIFIQLAEFPYFFDGLLLVVALQCKPVLNRTTRISNALATNKKALARDSLQSICLRETKILSTIGIAKTTIEVLVLRFCYQYVAVMFWYLLLGGAGALGYRLVIELSQSWNIKLSRFRHFGRPVNQLAQLMNWIPARLFIAALMLSENIANSMRALGQRGKYNNTHTALLAVIGGALGIQLSGPVIYQGKKYRYPRLGGPRLPEQQDIRRTLNALDKSLAVLLVICLLGAATLYGLRKVL